MHFWPAPASPHGAAGYDASMESLSCDVAVIGAGTAGLAAERSARRHGARTLLIDGSFAGTTCATVGCMPSKLLIAAADAAHAVRRAGIFGIKTSPPIVRGSAVMARVQRERDRFVAGTRASIDALPVEVKVRSRARFIDRTTLELDDGRQIIARAIVIASGSSASVPKAFDAVRRHVLTNESIFELHELPASVGVIGAGPLGLELAQALARLGVEVMVFDQAKTLAGLTDDTAMQELRSILAKEFPIFLGVELEARTGVHAVELSWSGATTGRQGFERLLLAAGRTPNLADLNLQAAGILLDAHGAPKYDPHTLQCDGSQIFIAGDADHDRAVLHEASSEGTIAGRNAAAHPRVEPATRMVRLAVTFTDPPVASIGAQFDAADEALVVGHASYEDQGRAKVFARNAGVARLYAEKSSGRLIGATLVGPGAEHYAHLLAWAVQQKMTASGMLDMPFYHPTYEEGLKPALRQICTAVHGPAAADRDDSAPPGA
jgi:dihydrolipoamide dehydrogenase